ncbi:MAG TPA: PTS glucose transporter subunit IIA [Mycobacterium sp.]|jgi:PTS system glucose-specific IIA component|nr:PTS glucose transporter subunit IIA [Mycobacterium sp.]
MGSTPVLAPVDGRAIALADVPDPVFAQGMVGHGAAIDPPHQVLDAVAPVSGTLLRLMPHAYVIMTTDGVGILVHLGLDTVSLNGAGFTALVSQGDVVSAGQPVITYDVPAIVAAGLSPVVPVVVMDEREASNITVGEAVSSGAEISPGALLFTAGK